MSKLIRFTLFSSGAACILAPVFMILPGAGLAYAIGLFVLQAAGTACVASSVCEY